MSDEEFAHNAGYVDEYGSREDAAVLAEARRARESEAHQMAERQFLLQEILRIGAERDTALDALVAADAGYGCCKDWHCEYCDGRKRVFQLVLTRAGRR
jgi:hypothetical protein